MESQICKSCVMDTSDPNIKFDINGVCERCNDFKNIILPQWNYGKGKTEELNSLVNKIKQAGKGKKYDCLLGLSGGFDSSYMLHFAIRELGLRPLVFHVDAGWNLPVGASNIRKLTDKLGLNLKIEKINWNEVRDLQLAFFKAGVPHLDIPQDHAFVSVLDKFAADNGIKYILNGGNISTEVVVPPKSWGYWGTDRRHINDIIKHYSTVSMDTYPFTGVMNRKLVMPYIRGVKIVKLLDYIPYVKKEAEFLLKNEYGWESYKQKHFESIMTKFIEGYWLPKRFGYDMRRPQFSSLILTGQMDRPEALKALESLAMSDQEQVELFELVAQMLEISTNELQQYFDMPRKIYKDFKNSERFFRLGAQIAKKIGIEKLIRK